MSAPRPSKIPPAHECWLPTLELAMQEVFDLMLAYPLEVWPNAPLDTPLQVSSMVGLAGQLSGVLTLRCSPQSAARMASRMLGADIDEDGPEVRDAIGEICNMAAGNFKNKISGLGDGCMLSVPTVITGQDYIMHAMGNETMQAVFCFENEPILLCLEVRR